MKGPPGIRTSPCGRRRRCAGVGAVALHDDEFDAPVPIPGGLDLRSSTGRVSPSPGRATCWREHHARSGSGRPILHRPGTARVEVILAATVGVTLHPDDPDLGVGARR